MLNVRYSSQFKKDYKLIQRRNYPTDELFKVIVLELALSGTGTHSDLFGK